MYEKPLFIGKLLIQVPVYHLPKYMLARSVFVIFHGLKLYIYNNIALVRIVSYTGFPFGIYTPNMIVCV